MKISISNIAWDKQEDERVYDILQENAVYGLDVAPARIYDNPFSISHEDGQRFIKHIATKGLVPVGMQSLLYGTQGLQLFQGEEQSKQTITHLKKMMDYAKKIGITRLVFGSPKNRLIKDVAPIELENKLQQLGDYATSKGLYFCIEPNPIQYGADFITNTLDGIKLVEKINNSGFRLHLDLGTMLMNHESIPETVARAAAVIEHVHLSHPNLEQVIGCEKQHILLRDALKKHNYKGVVAIEMKHSMTVDNVEKVRETVAFIGSIYGGHSNE
ncbi:MAG: TIM barrel protein [Oscillospiraceae bacterium]